MLLRRPPINWRYAGGEIAIIVVGILVAITLDNWNNTRLHRRTEREYLARLAEDLRTDTATFAMVDRGLQRKQEALASVDSVLAARDGALRDTIAFLQAVVSGSNFAWNQPRVRTTTFEELHSTGNLRLLRDRALRAQVVRYYAFAEGDYLRIAGRRTRYGPLTYELVPRQTEFTLDSARARAQSAAIVQAIMRSDLRAAIVAERNLASFVSEMNAGLKTRSRELLERLERPD